jgi:hypothetical protein
VSQCTKPGCKLSAWRKRLCFTHWRESQGFVFDSALKVFVKTKAAVREIHERRTAKAA